MDNNTTFFTGQMDLNIFRYLVQLDGKMAGLKTERTSRPIQPLYIR